MVDRDSKPSSQGSFGGQLESASSESSLLPSASPSFLPCRPYTVLVEPLIC